MRAFAVSDGQGGETSPPRYFNVMRYAMTSRISRLVSRTSMGASWTGGRCCGDFLEVVDESFFFHSSYSISDADC